MDIRFSAAVCVSSLTLLAGSTLAQSTSGDSGSEPSPTHHSTKASEELKPGAVVRVQGDVAAVEQRGTLFFFEDMATEVQLPEGYPAPTAPGAIEIKSYPSVRRAEVSTEMTPGLGQNVTFWPLFNHIKERDIPMTAPVEMDVPAMRADKPGQYGRWTMSFLYERPSQGPTGEAGPVVVRDTEPVLVLATGFRGDSWQPRVHLRLAELEQWLASQSEWERAAEGARIMGYNGPSVRSNRRWGEVQILIRRKSAAAIDVKPAEASDRPAEKPDSSR